jgi:hypothetical protein
MNGKAYMYLVLSCDGKPFTNVVTNPSNKKNAFKGWAALKAKYNAQDTPNYADLIEDFTWSRLENSREDPEEWIQRSGVVADETEHLNAKYRKQEEELIAHISKCLPKLYGSKIDELKCLGSSKKNYGQKSIVLVSRRAAKIREHCGIIYVDTYEQVQI